MSIEELFKFISEELKNCPGYTFLDKALADLRKAMEQRPYFKPEKFKEWFVERNVIYKNNPIAFLTKCGIQDIESGSFDKEHITGFAMYPLCKNLEERGITYTGIDTLTLDIYLTYIYNHDLMNIEEIRKWVHNAVEFIENHSKSASEFRNLFERSISMKRLRLPYKKLDEDIVKTNAEYEQLIKDLGWDKDDDLPIDKDWDGNPLESETNNEKENNQINNPST